MRARIGSTLGAALIASFLIGDAHGRNTARIEERNCVRSMLGPSAQGGSLPASGKPVGPTP